MQQWLRDEAGIAYPRVTGGYKAMRGFLLDTLDRAIAECDFLVLGGMTGTGKTEVLRRLDDALDLEGHANHRGSSFGKRVSGQPTQINFDNALAIDILRKRAAGHARFVVEDEGQAVGSCSLPPALYQGMQRHGLVWLEDSLENRKQRILRDYVIDLGAEFVAAHGAEQGQALFAQRLRQSLDNIARRLGGERQAPGGHHGRGAARPGAGPVAGHLGWIEGLLSEYYDPMYVYQRQQKASRIVFAGTRRR